MRTVWIAPVAACVALLFLTGALVVPSASGTVLVERLAMVIAATGAPVLGAVLAVERPANRYGWLWVAFGLTLALLVGAQTYAVTASVASTALPAVEVAVVAAGVGWAGTFGLAPLLLLLFPDGRLPSPRWRPLAGAVAIAAPSAVLAGLFAPGESGVVATENPLGVAGDFGSALWVVLYAAVLVLLIAIVASAASLVVRHRRARAIERRQIEWLAYAAALLAAVVIFTGLLGQELPRPWQSVLLATGLAGIQAGVAVAILRHGLYQLDVVVNRTVVYGGLTVAVAALYLGSVAGLELVMSGERTLLASLVAAGVVALIFAPARDRLQRLVNRLMYGDRDDPYTAVSRLGRRLEATLEPGHVLSRITEDVARTLRLPWVAIWLVEADALVPAAAHGTMPAGRLIDPAAIRFMRDANDAAPAGSLPASPFRRTLDRHAAALVAPLAHRGRLLALLALAARDPSEQLSAADRRLVRDLAFQAGAAVNGYVLWEALGASLADLRRSRERLVRHQAEERRRIQRDLHDGLGPILAAMRLQVEAAMEPAASATPVADDLERVHELIGRASSEVRRLVFGLRPPVLDQIGFVGALRQHAERFEREVGIRTDLEAPEAIDVGPAVDVALLRIAQEGLTNVARHAQAGAVAVRLWADEDWVCLEIRDDGIGLPDRTEPGTGITSIRERCEELGGTMRIRTHDGQGTTLTVRVPRGTTGQEPI